MYRRKVVHGGLAETLRRHYGDTTETLLIDQVCNEPGGPQSVPTAEAKRQQTEALLELVALARAEGTRLVTFANIPEHCDEANRACDFLSLNEYVGWYYDVGKPLAEIGRQLEAKFVALEAEYAVLSPNWRERTRLPPYSAMFRGIRLFVAPRFTRSTLHSTVLPPRRWCILCAGSWRCTPTFASRSWSPNAVRTRSRDAT